MTKLLLGVLDLPYADAGGKGKKGKRSKKPATNGGRSTGDVAEILEAKYAVIETFFDMYGDEIAEKLADSYEGALESMDMGAPITQDPSSRALAFIETKFRQFLEREEMNGKPGVPTMAAQLGHSKRFKNPYAKRGPRPSFIDTGLYESAFKAWLEE